MSTNKAQGQMLDSVGVYLPEHVFSHGQLYVALSRVHTFVALAVYVDNTDGYTKKYCLPRSVVITFIKIWTNDGTPIPRDGQQLV